MHKLQLNFTVSLPTTVSLTGGYNGVLRLLVIGDNECDGAMPAVAEIFQNSTIATGLIESYLEPTYMNKRWHIYMDEVFNYASPSATISGSEGGGLSAPINPEIKRVWNLSCVPVQWDDSNANALANLRNGHIFIYAFAQQCQVNAGVPTFTTADPPHIRYTSRVRYQDN